MSATSKPDGDGKLLRAMWLLSALIGLLLVLVIQWQWGFPLTNDGPAHLFSAFVRNHYQDAQLGFAEHYQLRNPITGNGWRLIAWMEPWFGWQLAYRLWYVAAAELAFLSSWLLWFAFEAAAGGARSRTTPWLALAASLPLAFPTGLYLGTVAYLLATALALGGLALLLHARNWRWFAGIGGLWLASAWFHPVPIVLAGLLAGLAVLARESRGRMLAALAAAAAPALVIVASYLSGGGELHEAQDNRFAPVAERTLLLMSKLLFAPPVVSIALLVAAICGVGFALRAQSRPVRGLATGAAVLMVASMVLPEHAFGWQMISGRLLPLAVPIALASVMFAPMYIRRLVLVPIVLVAALASSATWQRHRALAAASAEAIAGIEEMAPVRLRLVEIITRPFGTDAQDLDPVPLGMEPMSKLSSVWAITAGGRPMFTFANPKFAVHPLKLRASEPRSPFPVHDSDKVRDGWPERGDDLRRLASSIAPVGGLFAFGEPEDARVYDEAGFLRVGGRGAVYLGRFEGCRGRVRLSSTAPREVELTVGWWPRRKPQFQPVRVRIGPTATEVDPGLLGCGEVWATVAPGRCAEGLPARARFSRDQANLIGCTVVDDP